jgi:hypothetical protein
MTEQNPFLDFIEKKLLSNDFCKNFRNVARFWGVYGLSKNPSITTEFIEKHIGKPWVYSQFGLSRNTAINVDFIENNNKIYKCRFYIFIYKNLKISLNFYY